MSKQQVHGKNIEHFFICFHRAQSFAERLRLGIAVIHGEAQDAESDLVDGRHSPPMVKNIGAIHPSLEIPCKNITSENSLGLFCFLSYSLSSFFVFLFLTVLIPKEKPPITVVGDVGGRIAIIVVSSRWLEYLQDSVALVSLMYYHHFLLIFRMRFYVLLSLELSTFVLQRKLKEN